MNIEKEMSVTSNSTTKPILMKISAMCEREANRNGGIMGGVEVTFKLLVKNEQVYQSLVRDIQDGGGCYTSLLLDIIQKEFNYCHCTFTVATRARDIFIPYNYSNTTGGRSVFNQVFSDVAKLKYGHPHEDIIIAIKDYDLDNNDVHYAVAYHDRIEDKCLIQSAPLTVYNYDKIVVN